MRSSNLFKQVLRPYSRGISNTSAATLVDKAELAKNAALLAGGALLATVFWTGSSTAKADDRGDRVDTYSSSDRYMAKDKDTKKEQSKVPGENLPMSKRARALLTEALQPFGPIRSIAYHLVDYVWIGSHPHRQIENHLFCTPLNNDVTQCLIYDGHKSHSRLIGVEYIVSDRVYKTFSPEEQALWSSNAYEVTSGLVVAPRIPTIAEKPLMADLVNTYSKTIMTWQVDLNPLPLGIPQFAYKFTGDGQINPNIVKRRDVRLGINSGDIKKDRKDLEPPDVKSTYDQWGMKKVPQLVLDA